MIGKKMNRWVLCMLSLALLLNILVMPDESSAYTATGEFYVSGTKIIDPEGNEFIVKGTNINGYNSAWGGDTIGHLDLVKDVWKFNTIRLYCRIDPDYGGFQFDKEYLYDVIDTYTAAGIVVMPEVHDQKGSYFTSTSDPSLQDLKDFWEDLAIRYKDNSYVWFNIMNEPGSSSDKPVDPTWDSMHKELIDTIRDAGATDNIIVLDGSSWAQESAEFNTNDVVSSNSAFLTYGEGIKQYNNDLVGNDNVVFSVHFYREWVTRNGETADNKMADYIDRVHAKGLPLIVGEYGVYTNNDTTTATEAMRRVAFPRGVGRIVWHWLGGDDNELTVGGGGHEIDRTDGVKPGNLTWLGEFVWDDNHSSGGSTPPSDTYEAEDATLSGVLVKSDNSGYSGSGYGDYQNSSGDYIEWQVEVDASDTYQLEFQYANGSSTDRPLEIKVNGAVADSGLSFTPTGGWASWDSTTLNVSLNSGTNTIRATSTGSSGANVDYLKINESGGSGGDGSNVALNASASASATYSGNTADRAVDGDESTEWRANTGGANWLEIDLGGSYDLTGSEIKFHHTDRYYQFKVEVSADGSNWTTAVDHTSNTARQQIWADTFSQTNVRYVKIDITGTENSVWPGIYELKVFN